MQTELEKIIKRIKEDPKATELVKDLIQESGERHYDDLLQFIEDFIELLERKLKEEAFATDSVSERFDLCLDMCVLLTKAYSLRSNPETKDLPDDFERISHDVRLCTQKQDESVSSWIHRLQRNRARMCSGELRS